ncbi:MAG TPA: ABC transporter permease [Acidobacteria bacterium]|nr:ABC transporter permease [Acidobacteriota bacterium]
MARPGLWSTVRREVGALGRDRWQLALVSWLPVLLFLCLWWIFSAGLVTDIEVSVVDLDGSRLSRTFVRALDATPALRVAHHPGSVLEGRRALSNAETGALIVIPYDFQTRVSKGLKPNVTAFFNGQFILVGKAVKVALAQAQGTVAATVDAARSLAGGVPIPAAAGAAAPLVPQITPLFNVSMNYALFLVPGILPSLWQVIMIVGMVNAIGREIREDTWNRWLEAGPLRAFAGKMLPYVVIYSALGGSTLLFYRVLGWPVRGSWTILLAAMALTAVATAVMAGALYVAVRDIPRALSLAAAYTAPSFAFLGVTFPLNNMPPLARLWRTLIPVCHYMDVQILEMSRAAPLADTLPHLGALLVFLGVLPLVLLRLVPVPREEAGR